MMIRIETSLARYVDQVPNLRYVFFGGKGGVGKTVMAGAAALWLTAWPVIVISA